MDTRMMAVAALMLLAAPDPTLCWNCSSNCSCGIGPGYVFAECPSTRPTLTVRNVFRQSIKIVCYEPTTDLTLLQSLDVGSTQYVNIKQCPLPHTNYSALLESIGVKNYSRLDISDTFVSATDLRDHLFGIDSVTSLSLNNIDLEVVPEDLLQAVPQIKYLDMRYNRLKFPLGFFDHVPNLQRLEISGNDINYLEPGIFRNLNQLHGLGAWSNSLRNLTRETFVGLNQLELLDLCNNGIQELPDDVFAELQNLKFIGLNANHFTHLPSNLFRNTSVLEKVRLNDNRRPLASLPQGFLANLTKLREANLHRMLLSNIPEDLFHGSESLTTITLNGNSLRSLPPEVFRDNVHLLKLDLSRNKLEHLPDDIFSTLSELQFLDLSHNQLTTINKNLFETMHSLESLHVKHNSIKDVHRYAFFNLQKLRVFDISSNMVSFTESKTISSSSPLINCKNMEYMYLSNNYIGTIFDDWRNVMAKLKVIDLGHNQLTFIEVQDLTFVSRHVQLDITNNKISTINFNGADAIAASVTDIDGKATRSIRVRVSGNPLNCGCNVYDFLRYLELKISPEVSDVFEVVHGNLECSSPPMYRGKKVSDLQTEHFLCGSDESKLQEQSICPLNCTCYAKLHSKALIVDCSNAGLSQAPEELSRLPSLVLTHTQLLLQGNLITSLPDGTRPGYEHVTFINMSNNRLTTLQENHLPPKLKILDLSYNNLAGLDKPVLLALTNRTSVSLQGNPWSCSCRNRDLLTFLHTQFRQVFQLQNIECITQNGTSVPLARMTVDEICSTDTVLNVILATTIVVVGLLLGVVAILLCCYQHKVTVWLYTHGKLPRWVTKNELNNDQLYDAFISFSHGDEDFVVKELVPRLEDGPRPFKICKKSQDSVSEEFIALQIDRAISESRRVLVVLSPNFLKGIWGQMELRVAHQRALARYRTRIIFVLYGDIGPVENLDPELTAHISKNTYIKWGDPWFWDQLRCALPHKPLVMQKQRHLNTAANTHKMDLMVPVFSIPVTTKPPADKVLPAEAPVRK